MAASKKTSIDPAKLTRRQLLNVINGSGFAAGLKQEKKLTTATTIGNWVGRGAPVNEDGKTINLVDLLAWFVHNQKNSGRTVGEVEDIDALQIELTKSQIDNNHAMIEYRNVKTDLESYKSMIQAGELRKASEVEEENIAKASFVRNVIESIGTYAPRLQGKNIVEIRKELIEVGRKLLISICSEYGEGEK